MAEESYSALVLSLLKSCKVGKINTIGFCVLLLIMYIVGVFVWRSVPDRNSKKETTTTTPIAVPSNIPAQPPMSIGVMTNGGSQLDHVTVKGFTNGIVMNPSGHTVIKNSQVIAPQPSKK